MRTLICSAVLAGCLSGQSPDVSLADMGLSDLSNLQVTSVARKRQRLVHSPAAAYVITRQAIRRSGAITLPEALRLAPGVHAARITANQWAVTVRGFNGRWANKLLVLIDGRIVYSPLFSGVHWDAADVPIQDVERIEIIRGPGATMWGANAVHGVINIITRSAQDAAGAQATVAAGHPDQVYYGSYGGNFGKRAHYRLYAHRYSRTATAQTAGIANDFARMRVGLRGDWAHNRDRFTFTTEVFGATAHEHVLVPGSAPFSPRVGIDLNSRPRNQAFVGNWQRELSETSTLSLQGSFNNSRREESANGRELRQTTDVDAQHRFRVGSRHDFMWGGQVRSTADDFATLPNLRLNPESRTDTLLAGFVQDEFSLLPDKLHLVAGVKLERNSYQRKLQWQPSTQLLWMPSRDHTAWASVARALRNPSRGDTGVEARLDPSVLGSLPFRVQAMLQGNPEYGSEEMLAYEAGYRWESGKFSADLTAFTNRYTGLLTFVQQSVVFRDGVPTIPISFENATSGESFGAEASVSCQVTPLLRLESTYSWLSMRLRSSSPRTTPFYVHAAEGESPLHQGRLTALWTPARRWTWDTTVYLVDRLPVQQVAGYASVLSRVSWHITNQVEASATADNLLDNAHQEFHSPRDFNTGGRTWFGRSVRGGLTWIF